MPAPPPPLRPLAGSEDLARELVRSLDPDQAARAILLEPDYLFLDEATASLDEASEQALYRLLKERLPATALISIGHRSTLFAFHRRRLVLERDGERSRIREQEQPAAAARGAPSR